MIYKVSEEFIDKDINPFTNKEYDSSWIAYCLTDSEEYEVMVGGGLKSIYTLKVSKKHSKWKMSLMDFIEFQTRHNKNIILSVSDDDLYEAKIAYNHHYFNEPYLRDYEPQVMVHSTSIDCWQSIKKDNCLKSWNILSNERKDWERKPIGNQLGDPEDFMDYIMFSDGGISSEIVVLSKQNGKILTNPDNYYEPGVRLYFDMRKVAEDGLLIRDGCHLKVKDTLPLSPYLIWAADWKSVGLSSRHSTPSEFTCKANSCFNKIYGKMIFESF